MTVTTETILASAATDGLVDLHAYHSHLTPEEEALVVGAHSMPLDRSGAAEPGTELRYYARRAREAVACGDLNGLLAVIDAVDLYADRLDAEGVAL